MLIYTLFSCFVLGLILPMNAAGSGVPPLKSVLGGVHVYKFLHWKILLAKYFGLLGTLASGVGSGKEGPMIHMSAMISYNLGYLPWFKDVMSDPYRKKMLLNAAVACGVTSTFGAPYGAMIFSVELCSTVFLLSNLWRLFVTATVVKIVYDICHTYGYVVNIESHFVYDFSQNWNNFPHFIVLGIISGWAASLWIWLFSQFLQFKAQVPIPFIKNRYFYTILMSLVISLLQFWLNTSWKGNKGLLISLWSHDELDVMDPGTFPPNKVWEELLGTVFLRWLMIMCFATMPIPCGIALPSITQGAFIGRFYGEILKWYVPQTQAQAFSIVGAAAFGGVMTRATSISLLIIELTGKTELILGILTANMFSYAIANLFTMSAFNTMMSIGKMPFLPYMFYSTTYKKKIGEFMDPATDCIEENGRLCDVLEFFANRELFQNDEFVPIVETLENKKIIGSVRSWNMLEYINKVCIAIDEETKKGNTSLLVQKFEAKLQSSGHQGSAEELFAKMPSRLREWVDEIRNNEAKLEFANGGLQNVQGKSKSSALRDKWLEAFELVKKRKAEKDGGDVSNIQADEYYLFTKFVLARMTTDWENTVLKFNSYPICVDENTKLVKVHFLFQMLGVRAVYIAKRGEYIGVITLEKFLNLRYTEQTYM